MNCEKIASNKTDTDDHVEGKECCSFIVGMYGRKWILRPCPVITLFKPGVASVVIGLSDFGYCLVWSGLSIASRLCTAATLTTLMSAATMR